MRKRLLLNNIVIIIIMRQHSGGLNSQKLDIRVHKMIPINNKMSQRCAKIKPRP